MNVSHIAALLIMLALPGVISVQFFRRTIGRQHRSHWDYFAELLISSTIAYLFLGLLYGLGGCEMVVDDLIFSSAQTSLTTGASADLADRAVTEIIWATVIGLALSIGRTFIEMKRLSTRALAKLKLSNRSEDEDIWKYFFAVETKDFDYFVVRDDENGITYSGQPIAHSDHDRPRELVLSDVTVTDMEGKNGYTVARLYLSFPVDSSIVIETGAIRSEVDHA